MRHRLNSSSWAQRTPAGLPWGMPGIGELMEGAMQQAPQPGRQFMRARPAGARTEGSEGVRKTIAICG